MTTPEHPFWVRGKGWLAAGEMRVGDQLVGADGLWVEVEGLVDAGEWAVVYNLRIAEHHTYFVGCEEWGFSAWAHNAACAIEAPASSNPDAPIQDFVPAPAVPDSAYAHLAVPSALTLHSASTLIADGLVAGTQWSFSQYGQVKNLTVSHWIHNGDIRHQSTNPDQKYLFIVLPSNPEYSHIGPHPNPVASANGVPEFRTKSGAGTVYADRIIEIPRKSSYP